MSEFQFGIDDLTELSDPDVDFVNVNRLEEQCCLALLLLCVNIAWLKCYIPGAGKLRYRV